MHPFDTVNAFVFKGHVIKTKLFYQSTGHSKYILEFYFKNLNCLNQVTLKMISRSKNS